MKDTLADVSGEITENDQSHETGTHADCGLCGGRMRPMYDFGRHAVVYCADCRLGRLAPMPGEHELDEVYASRAYFEGGGRVGYADYAGDAAQFARTFRDKLSNLRRFGHVTDLLEVGCGPGYFLLEARRAGIAGAVGVDRNPWAVEETRRRGFEAYLGSIAALPADRSFDAVVLLDVLEHIPDPEPFLAAVAARLRPGGRILLMTPNIRSLLARFSGRRWVSFKIPEHVHYFSPRSIRRLLNRAGFDVLTCRPAGQWVTLDFALDRLARLVPRPSAVLAAAARGLGLRAAAIFVPNGSIDVVARRRPGNAASDVP